MGKWTVDIGGTNRAWKKIHFTKVHPSPDPDTFEITFNEMIALNYFDYVIIRRFGITKFFGYIENVEYAIEESVGTVTIASGRCRKLIVWKKFMERYIDTRLKGFFSNVYPHEVFKFLLRCPKSDVPLYDEVEDWDRDYPRHKIGWGIASETWYTWATDAAEVNKLYAAGTDPAYPRLRISGFYWRNRGQPSNIITRLPDGIAGAMQWAQFGAAGVNCINTDDGNLTYIWAWNPNALSYEYTFQDLGGTATGINTVILHVKARKFGGFPWNQYKILVRVYDGTSWLSFGYAEGTNTDYHDFAFDVSSHIDTVAKFNAMRVTFTLIWGGGWGAHARITYAYAVADYATGGVQTIGDQFRVDLGIEKTRVCGIIIQSRSSADQYARNYAIEYSTDGVGWAELESVVNNTAQDIIHSWNPITMRYIRIRITAADATHAWEITQIYVYQADDADYTVLESTISPNIIMNSPPYEIGGWAYKKKITVDSSKVDANLNYFPVLVHLTSGNFDFTKARTNGEDIRFAQGDAKLAHEIENWDSTGQVAFIWVRVPNILAASDVEIYMYYGNTLCPDAQDMETVWDDNFIMVYHMVDDPDVSNVTDSTQYNEDGTKKGANEPIEIPDGKIYEAQDFDGVDDFIQTPALSLNLNTTAFTFSAIVKVRVGNVNNWVIGVGANIGLLLQNIDGVNYSVYPWCGGAGGANGAVSYGAYHHIVLVYQGFGSNNIDMYVDGAFIGTQSLGATGDYSGTVRLGVNAAFAWILNGIIDETRISNVARSAAWIKASYYTGLGFSDVSPDDNFLSYGEEEVTRIQPNTTLLKAFNMPYQRLTDGLDQVCFASFTASYLPWEWWIDEHTGEVYFASAKGEDKSADIQFLNDMHIKSSSNKYLIKKTAQRVRTLGKGEGRRQDEVTSNWQVDAGVIATINTFYEELINEKAVSYTETANEWARVWLAQLKDIVQEVKHTISYDPYNETDYDVGDTISTRDTRVGINLAARQIKKMEVTVTSRGELIVLTCVNRWEDISDRIASLFKKIQKLELSSTGVEDWTAGGSLQGKVTQEKMEGYWSMKRKYDDVAEFSDHDPATTQTTYYVNPAAWVAAAVGDIAVSKEMLIFMGPSGNTGGAVNPELYVGNPTTGAVTRTIKWNRNPKFMCKVKITEGFIANNDYILIGMEEPTGVGTNLNRFGFYIEWNGSTHVLKAMMASDSAMYTRDFGSISVGSIYELEAHVDWDDKMVFFSVGYPSGTKQLGVIPFDPNVDGETALTPMWVKGWLTGDGVGQASLDFYIWKSQGLKEAESE